VNLRGEAYVLWRAVDEHGTQLDVLLQKCRDKAAAKRFFKRMLRSAPVPQKIVTDQLRSYRAAKAEVPELAGVKHVFVKAAARLNNRAENSHQPTRRRERQMQGFRDPQRTQAFLSRFGPIRQHRRSVDTLFSLCKRGTAKLGAGRGVAHCRLPPKMVQTTCAARWRRASDAARAQQSLSLTGSGQRSR
jgi:transposase-like protein